MRLYQGTAASSSSDPKALADALLLFAALSDYATGSPNADGERAASLAVALARLAGATDRECDALAFAGRLRNIGALANPALQKGTELPGRVAAMALTDIPAAGARICERFAALPSLTADLIRWQAEAWDGTGYPDQLRWQGIPAAAQLLHIAAAYVQSGDPEEAFAAILRQSGRIFGPEHTRTFVMWYHTNGGDVAREALPAGALDTEKTHASDVLQLLGERIDAHNGTPGRWQRVGARAERVAEVLQMSNEERNQIALASLLFAAGELRQRELESLQFDPLSRLGVDVRARNASDIAGIVAGFPTFGDLAPVLGARGEWYDGTGSPKRLRHEHIPPTAQVLAVAIAFDGLDEAYRTRIGSDRQPPLDRLDEAAGTQFDPRVVRAIAQVVRAA